MVSTSMHHILLLAWHGGIHFYLSVSSTRVSSVRNALRVSSFCPAIIAHSCSFRLMTGGLEFSLAWQPKRLSRWNLRSLRTIWAMLIVEFVHPFLAHVGGNRIESEERGQNGWNNQIVERIETKSCLEKALPQPIFRSFTWSKAHSGVARECLWQHRSFQPLESRTP